MNFKDIDIISFRRFDPIIKVFGIVGEDNILITQTDILVIE